MKNFINTRNNSNSSIGNNFYGNLKLPNHNKFIKPLSIGNLNHITLNVPDL